ncbi:MAG: DUF4412 domain-containing protein [Bacteroidales bacterium]|nr:DUF4412 domain-containing protein [Bacteroidales bacterium]
MIVLLFFYVVLLFSGCNTLSGDNKATTVDSSPKPQLATLSLRTDVPAVFTNDFSGIIQFIEKSLFDTVTYEMYVYKNFVKIDKYRKNEKFESLIIDLLEKKMHVLNHNKKLFSTITVNEEKSTFDSTFKVIKTENEKTILGKKCKQWRVKNIKENTEITYWVDSSNYGFYYYLIKVWNSTTKPNKYFQLISNSFGTMPLEIIERNTLRDIKCSYSATKVEYCNIDSSIFTIPSNYTLFSN